MKKVIVLIFMFAIWSPFQGLAESKIEIPDEYESISALAEDAIEFASACNPKIDVNQIKGKIEENKRNMLHSAIWQGKSTLLFADNRIICQRLSKKGHPIIPLSEFEGTISFPGMSPEQQKQFYKDISQQLTEESIVSVLVTNELGNMTNVVYSYSSSPMSLRYDAIRYSKGEKVALSYSTKYNVNGGSTVIARSFGKGGEQKLKLLGVKDWKNFK